MYILAGATALTILGGAAMAQDVQKDKERDRIVIIDRGVRDHELHAHLRDNVRELLRDRAMVRRELHPRTLRDCEGEKTEINEGEGKDKIRILVCGKPNMSAEERAKELEDLRKSLAERGRRDAEDRARMDARLQEAINRIRSGK